jgi:hypothetical protein
MGSQKLDRALSRDRGDWLRFIPMALALIKQRRRFLNRPFKGA